MRVSPARRTATNFAAPVAQRVSGLTSVGLPVMFSSGTQRDPHRAGVDAAFVQQAASTAYTAASNMASQAEAAFDRATGALLPVRSQPMFHLVWSRFRLIFVGFWHSSSRRWL